ncbi:glucodextranase DOMON-like domain-containing protein [Actibacterium sp. 188UL27-1]|uniref:glucodextranase DOMON-like domain-containing protein n=1 Tax=Actibacterium sp. 188UL27-1 TaxID=2786961 RepID=UPI00195C254F|nr:glucodextranase DOMON-like domain-containing protein [Actibacterium sp. 188UL27-1]MBM7069164.1 hypothetical protein [Actibacterium sp. 188UL27-1]
MMRPLASLILTAAFALPACADGLTFTDPAGDDVGAGALIYPTNPVFRPGAFDLLAFSVTEEAERLRLDFDIATPVQNEWNMAGGFDVQLFFVFVDTGTGGHVAGLPGLNITFAPDAAWDRAIIVSPQPQTRVMAEIPKAKDLAADILVATDVSANGTRITGYVAKAALGDGTPAEWGYQVVVQSNEGFPEDGDLLTRRVNEFEGEYRFGGGHDGNCDPHVVDVLGPADQLAYDCGATLATLTMTRP